MRKKRTNNIESSSSKTNHIISTVALAYEQPKEHYRVCTSVALTGFTVKKIFRDSDSQGALLVVDNIYRLTPNGYEVCIGTKFVILPSMR